MALTGNNNEEKIWNYLSKEINNKYGVAGLMGNLYAESALKPNNLQNSYEIKLGMDDETYTSKVNSGSYSNFIRDSAGYGLAQWTFWTRKQALLQAAREKKVSIGDLEMQLEFLIKELKGYTSVWNSLINAKSILEASNVVLLEYERPANQSESVQKTRANYGETYYNRYAGGVKEETKKEASNIYTLASKSSYAKYLVATNTHYISNSGGDERGGISGGSAGDQTGKEWIIRSWYNRPWDCVLRYPDPKVGIKIAELGCMAALNDHVGYDQGQRQTYWQCLQKANYDPSKITTNCEADCSAGVIANTKAVGYLLNISKLKDISATYTGNMKQAYINAGFEVLTGSQYKTSPDYLVPGDILLNENHHTATVLTMGMKVRSGNLPGDTPSYDETSNALKYGSSGSAVKTMQEMLIALKYDLGSWGADGDFGSKTLAAVRQFQADQGIVVDGVYGPTTKAKLEQIYKEKTAKTNPFKSYLVKVTADALNIRERPTTSSKIAGVITDQGVYTIVEVSGTWGKLKSGAGWISLKYTRKINK